VSSVEVQRGQQQQTAATTAIGGSGSLQRCSCSGQISRTSHFGYAAAQERTRGSRRESWGWQTRNKPEGKREPRLRGSRVRL